MLVEELLTKGFQISVYDPKAMGSCKEVFGGRTVREGWERVLFGIMQGGVHEDLRRQSADAQP